MQTIIGAGGSVGIPLAAELNLLSKKIRLVSRNPRKLNNEDELFPLDINNLGMIREAVKGSEVVYVTIGFPYNLKDWQRIWPPFLKAVIDACELEDSKMVFVDNVYMYAKSAIGHMREDSPIDPPSRKGLVREVLHNLIMEAAGKKRIEAIIARAADFYGPTTPNSIFSQAVCPNLLKGKKAQAFGDIDRVHSFTFTPDAGKAVAMLGNTKDAYNRVWHLPTTAGKLTMREWIGLITLEMMKEGLVKKEVGIQTVPAWIVKLLGIFVPAMKEFPEMFYQYEQDYFFESNEFTLRFGMVATDPQEGVRRMVAALKKPV